MLFVYSASGQVLQLKELRGGGRVEVRQSRIELLA